MNTNYPVNHPINIAHEQRMIRLAWERQTSAQYGAYAVKLEDSKRLQFSDRK